MVSSYNLPASGTYVLEFGVVNWNDTSVQSGMAIDGITIGGQPVESGEPIPTVSEWGLGVLVSLLALAGIAFLWNTRT